MHAGMHQAGGSDFALVSGGKVYTLKGDNVTRKIYR
jgi:hypothetical protein